MINFSTARLESVSRDELVGKTVTKVTTDACNVMCLEFSDGTSLAIEAIYEGRLPFVEIW